MTTPRSKRGRPAKPEGEARTLSLPSIRVNAVEMAHIEAQAATAGLSISDYVRSVATHRQIAARQTPLEGKLLFELNRCGVNLHQIVRALNFGRNDLGDLDEILAELKTAIAHVSASYDP